VLERVVTSSEYGLTKYSVEATRRPNGDYLDRMMRRESFQALWPLFSLATKPAKEMTESFSALVHLRPFMAAVGDCRVIHVGDGAHARTGALFAVKTKAENISVDPVTNEALVSAWRDKFNIERFSWRKAKLADAAESLCALSRKPLFVTFVHAHVDIDEELRRLKWDVAFTMACCLPGRQLTRENKPHSEGQDFSVLSDDRHYQVLVNKRSPLIEQLLPTMKNAASASTGG